MSSEKLAPCIWCGGRIIGTYDYRSGKRRARVECVKCDMRGPAAYRTQREALADYNALAARLSTPACSGCGATLGQYRGLCAQCANPTEGCHD